MRLRIKRSRRKVTYYYYVERQDPRREELLAVDNIHDALDAYERKVKRLSPEDRQSALCFGEGALNDDDHKRIFATMSKGAKTRGLELTLSESDIKDMLNKSGGRCAVTGLLFNNTKPSHAKIRPWVPSVDRIDSTKGYITGNVRLVCACVNLAMNQFGDEVLLMIATGIIKQMGLAPVRKNY